MQEIMELNKENVLKIIKDNLSNLTSNYLGNIKKSLKKFEEKIKDKKQDIEETKIESKKQDIEKTKKIKAEILKDLELSENIIIDELLNILILLNPIRWDGKETTNSGYSSVLPHSTATAKIINILVEKESNKKELIIAGLFHDICETVFPDVTVGERKDLDIKLGKIFPETTIGTDFKELQEEIAKMTIFIYIIKKLNLDGENIKFLQEILSNESNPIVQFTEKLESSLLYLREGLSDNIKDLIFPILEDENKKKKQLINVLSYSMEPLKEIIKDKNIGEKTKENCINFYLDFVNEFQEELKNKKLKDRGYSGFDLKELISDQYLKPSIDKKDFNEIKKISDDEYKKYSKLSEISHNKMDKEKYGIFCNFKECIEDNNNPHNCPPQSLLTIIKSIKSIIITNDIFNLITSKENLPEEAGEETFEDLSSLEPISQQVNKVKQENKNKEIESTINELLRPFNSIIERLNEITARREIQKNLLNSVKQ